MEKGLDKKKKKKLKVVELFAGVGGFKLGLEGWNGFSASSNYSKKLETNYSVVWSNQWEPSTKIQHASDIYVKRFGLENHSNEDIAKVDIKDIPEHDMLVGGFPCQDYSVAKQLSKSEGIKGKKGVLWWEIHRILENKTPKFIFLENVDRLIKSPVKQRGKDFAIILASLNDLGYAAEWRVVNAADYGMPQRRRRVFIFGYHKGTPIYKKVKPNKDWIIKSGLFAKAFDVSNDLKNLREFEIVGDLFQVSENFNKTSGSIGVFGNSGVMINRNVFTGDSFPNYDGPYTVIKDIVQDYKSVPKEYFIDLNEKDKWEYLKGKKNEPRTRSDGETFFYKEGPMAFPDPLDKPARTIITSEGGKTPSRFKHVIKQNGKLRRLTPLELEKLNMFPENHTCEANDTKRAFFMGNALVVGVIEKVGVELQKMLGNSK